VLAGRKEVPEGVAPGLVKAGMCMKTKG